MKLLLDTHVFLWHLLCDPRLPGAYLAAIKDPRNDVYLSIVSVWEATIKHQLGKLPLPTPAARFLIQERDALQIAPLSVDDGAMPFLESLPQLHRDPFDRLLIAQALQHNCTLLTVDANIAAYGVPVLPS